MHMFLTTAIKTFSIYVSLVESDLNMCNLTNQFYFFYSSVSVLFGKQV